MVYNAEKTADRATADTTNDPGYCLQQCRIWAGIDARYADAATAWRNTNDRHPGNRNPPRGSMVYWTGGSHGYGHIACSLGNGRVRSTDAGGSGRVATVDLGWVENNWGLPYAGWAWDVNEVTIPHGGGGDDDMPLSEDDLSKIAKRVNQVLGDFTADGTPRDIDKGSAGTSDQADTRLRQIETVVRDIQQRVKNLEGG